MPTDEVEKFLTQPESGLEQALRAVEPEDVEKRFRLLSPVERQMARESRAPEAPPKTTAAKIARLLWFKTHPAEIETTEVLQQIRDQHPIVRLTAAETVSAALQAASGSWQNPKAIYHLRHAIESQRSRESSAVITFLLQDVLDRLARIPTRERSSTSMVVNPFIAGPVVRDRERFFGREEILAEIGATLAKGKGTRSIIIHGARRTGKSSLLYRIAEGALGELYVPVYIDLQALSGATHNLFFGTLARQIEQAAGQRDEGSGTEAEFPLARERIRAALNVIAPRCLLILFDEYEVLQDYVTQKQFARQLQSLAESEVNLSFIFAGATKVDALPQKQFMQLLDNAKSISISFLSPSAAARLITEPARGLLDYDTGIVEHLQELCRGHPFYTQTLCHSIFEIARETGRVERKQVDLAVDRFLENPPPHLVLSWNGLDLEQKIVAASLAEIATRHGVYTQQWISASEVHGHLVAEGYPIRLRLTDVRRTLSELREQDWITREGQSYHYTMLLIRLWISRHRTIWDVLTEQERGSLARPARVWQRIVTSVVDLFAIISVYIMGIIWLELESGGWLATIAVAYYFSLMFILRCTPGMFAARMRPVSEAGARLTRFWSAGLGCTRAVFPAMAGLGLAVMEEASVQGIVFLAAGLLPTLVSAARAYFSKNRRGLYERLFNAVYIDTAPASLSPK